jgi:hypothetical protein
MTRRSFVIRLLAAVAGLLGLAVPVVRPRANVPTVLGPTYTYVNGQRFRVVGEYNEPVTDHDGRLLYRHHTFILEAEDG